MYDINSPFYMGEVKDGAGNTVHGFYKDEAIHLVYNLGKENEYNNSKLLEKVLAYEDEYMWTPYALFSYKAEKLSKQLV